MPTETITSMEPTVNGMQIITVEKIRRPGWLGRMLGRKEQTTRRRFVGSCTVWRHYPEFIRCGLYTEMWLADIWDREKHRRALETESAGGLKGKR